MSPDWSAREQPVPYGKIDDPQTLNLYAYVLNNPLSQVDPDGHLPCNQGDWGCESWSANSALSEARTEAQGGQLPTFAPPPAQKQSSIKHKALAFLGKHRTAVKVVSNAIIVGTVISGAVDGGASEAAVPEEAAGEAALDAAIDAEAEDGTAGELKYSDRVEARSAEEPGPNHNFPRSFDKEIMQNGQRTVGRDGYEQFNLRGTVNGKEGTYELGTQNGEVTHRFFRPD